jgi:hypothetical protein
MKTSRVVGLILAWAALAAAAPPAAASDLVQVVVTATAKKGAPPPIERSTVVVFQEKQRRPVIDWVPLKGGRPMNLALMIDETVGGGFGIHLDSLSSFIRALPPNVRVAVIYARNANATVAQNFTSDHAAAAQALRLPLGSPGAIASPYLALLNLLERWPEDGNPGQVLLVSHGIDLFRGASSSAPGVNPDLRRAIETSLRRGIVVNTLYASGSGRAQRNRFLVSNGQGSLSRLAQETGGEAFFQGFSTPVSFKPFLNELGENLGQQYLLTFRAQPGKKASYQRLRVDAEVAGVKLTAPARVYIPAE